MLALVNKLVGLLACRHSTKNRVPVMLTLIQNITILGMLYSVHAPFLKAVKLIFICL